MHLTTSGTLNGTWTDYVAPGTSGCSALCERPPQFALQYKLIEQSNRLNATIELKSEEKQANDIVHVQLVETLNEVNCKPNSTVSALLAVKESQLQMGSDIESKLQMITYQQASNFNSKLVDVEKNG